MIEIKNEEIFEEVDEIKSVEVFESDNNKTFFKGSGENLKNYRIYGENGKNLLNDKELKIGGLNAINGEEIVDTTTIRSPFIKGFFSNYRYYLTLFNDEYKIENIYYYNYNYLFLGKIEVNSNYTNFVPISSTLFIKITFKKKNETQNISTLDLENKVMLSKGKVALSYEPYGESVGDRTGNLFYKKIENANIASNDGRIYSTESFDLWIGKVKAGETYTSYNIHSIVGFFTDEPDYGACTYDNSRITNATSVFTFTVPSGCSYVAIRFLKNATRAMLNLGDTALPYEPYGYKVPVTVEGKNLLPNTATSQTINGVAFTVNDDGSVTCNGTATAITTFAINIGEIPNGIYIVSGCPNNGAYNTYRIDIRTSGNTTLEYNSEYVVDTGNGHLFDSTDAHSAVIRINTGYTCNNLTFYPMVRKADIEDATYEPYHAPVTTPIYLDAPLCKANGEEEYIDFLTQKVHRIQKNLLPNNTQLPTTINGVKWSIRESDGAIMAERVSPSESPSDLVYTSSFIAPANQIFVLKLFYEGEEPSATTYSVNVIYNNIDHWNRNGMYRFETDTEMSVVLRVSPEYNGIAIFAPMISNYNYNDFFDYTPYIQNTEQSIILPAISTFSDTNILSVNTKVEPSKIWGRISEPRDIEYVKDNLGNVLFSKYNEIEEEPPLTYKAKKAGTLTDYRIYGQTSRNLFDVTAQHTIAYETCYQYIISGLSPNLNYTCSTNYNQKNHKDACVYFGGSATPRNGVWQNEPKTYKPNNDGEIIILIRFIQYQESLPIYDAVVSGDIWIMVNEGDSPLPYEPYGESVGDRTGNLFDKTNFIQTNLVAYDNKLIVPDPYTISTILPCNPNTKYTISKIVTNRFVIWGCTDYPTTNKYCNRRIASDFDSSSLTFTTGNDDNYLLVMLFYKRQPTDPTIEDIKGSLMFNYGEALPYEPYGYKVPVTVEGKNLFDGEFLQGYWAWVNGLFNVSNKWISTKKIPCKSNAQYTFSSSFLSRWAGFLWYDENDNYLSTDTAYNITLLTKTSPSNTAYMAIDIAGYPDAEANIKPSDVTDFMLVESSTPLPYEPYHAPVTTPIYLPEQIKKVGDEAEYIDYGEQKQHKVRKNLLQNTAISQTINGVTFTVNSDGSVICNTDENGATASTRFYLVGSSGSDFKKININANARITGCPLGGNINTYALFILRKNDDMAPGYYNTWAEIGNGWILPYSETDKYVIYINISTGTICDNLTFYPMIRLATIKDDTYEPYIENTDIDVTLPALPTVTGTNVLSVGTEVQPSEVYVKGKIKEIN